MFRVSVAIIYSALSTKAAIDNYQKNVSGMSTEI